MKKYLISGFNTVQDVKLEVGTYTLVAYVKSMHGDVYTFALWDGTDWEEFSIDVIQGQLCKVWLTFTIDKKATKFKPIANNFTEELPVYVADLQLTRGNIPVESGASPFDIDQILNDLHDEIDAIEDFTEGAFLDGLLSREEKTQLRASLDAIGSIVESVKGSYDKLLDNPFIHENTMTSITARFYAFYASWISDGDPRGLKPVILWIVNGDNIVDQNERDEKDRALNAFNDALYAYNQAEKEVYNDVGENSIAPIIDENGMWAFWSTELQEFIPSEFSAEGDEGHSPYIDVLTGTWWEWSPELGEYKDTFIKAEGVDGEDAVAPIIIDGFWAFWSKELQEFVPSEFSAIGDDGHAPIIRDGYWYEWNPDSTEEDKYESTGVRAEGIKGDGSQQRFLSSYEKPIRPTGDALGWSNIPDEEDAPGAPPEIVGSNLYDRQYLISNGWTYMSPRTWKNINAIGGENLIDPSKFKANTQYKLDYNMSGQPGTSNIVIEYASGGADVLPLKVETLGTYISIADRTVVSIRLGNGLINVFDSTSIYEMNQDAVQAKPIWTVFRNITNGIASEWSIPVKWLGEGTPGKKGDKGDGITMKAPVQDYAELIALPPANNVNGDARIVKIGSNSPTNDGHLWVWNTEVTPAAWFDTGKFQGDKSYFHIAYCSYPDRKVEGATAAANKIAMEFSQYADGRDYLGRKATYQGTYADWTEGGEDANSPWKWQEVKGDKGDKGEKGDDGTSVNIKGSKDYPYQLPPAIDSELGDGYIIDSDIWIFDNISNYPPATWGWVNAGKIQGDSAHLHIAWADVITFYTDGKVDPNGVLGFTLNDSAGDGKEGKRWFGVYADNTVGDSTDPVKYSWTDAKGEDALVGFLTNESVTVQASSDGTVDSLATATGTFELYEGLTKVTSGKTYAKVSNVGCVASIDSDGVYSISSMSADNATATFSVKYKTATIEKTFSISKSRAGQSAPLLIIAESAQIMICNDDNIAETGQTIEIEAKLQNVTGTDTADFVAKAYNVSGSPISGNITLGGTGNVRTLTNLQWLSTYKKVVITVTLDSHSLTDVTTIHRLNKPASGGIDGINGVDAVVGFLTNENITVQASATGVVGLLDTAVGYFRLYSGVTPVTSGITFSRVSQTGCEVTIDATTGYYTVNTLTADNASAIFKVKYGTLEIEKVLTLSKSKAGSKGDTGDKGDTGEDGEPPKILNGYPKTQYAIGDSKTIYPTIGWGEAVIDVTESKPYLWSRQEIKYDSGDTLYTGYLMLTNITPAAYMAGEWDLKVAYTRNDKSYPIVTYKKGTNNRPLYYYPKKEGVIRYEYFVTPPSEPSSGWYKKGDIVWYEDTNEDYPVILGLYKANKNTRLNPYSGDWDNVTADYAPNGVEGQKLWEFADGMELIITEALMANYAKLDSFVFHKGKMFSQEGTLRGVAGSVEYTDEDHEPNFEVDGKTGRVKMKDAEVEGSIVTNRSKGRISLNENYDNLLVFRHPNGNKAVEFGVVNGEAALIWYNENNEEVWRGGISGIEYKNYVAASWSERKVTYIGAFGEYVGGYENEINNIMLQKICRSVIHGDVAVAIEGETTVHKYDAGTEESLKQYNGIHATDELSLYNFIDGWYMHESYLKFIEWSPLGNVYSYTIVRYNNGKAVQFHEFFSVVNLYNIAQCSIM